MKDFEVRPIEHRTAKPFIEHWHYSHNCPTGFNIFFGAFIDGKLYAVADYGSGSNMDKGANLARLTGCPVRTQEVTQKWLDDPHKNMNLNGLVVGPRNCLELKRLCRQGEKGAAKIPLTRFLSICYRVLRREHAVRGIVSYSDFGQLRTERVGTKWVVPPDLWPVGDAPSCGLVYQAANFQYLGRTAPDTHTVRDAYLYPNPVQDSGEKDGEIVHRRVAYKEMKRRKKRGEVIELEAVRIEHGRVPIVTPPKERWFYWR